MSNNANKPIIKIVKKKTEYDIHERIYDFVVRVIKLTNSVPNTSANSVIIPQLLRCVTSMGANDSEADGTLTKKDFIHCYTVVRKENKETIFWLRLIAATNAAIENKMEAVIQEGKEIAAIISTIINNTRNSTNDKYET